MGDTQAAASANPTATNDDDWLGYGAYAEALWSRIETALAKDLIKGDLGDDPLVIGIFGEWGAGKSYLLRLMHDQSKAYAEQRLGWHKNNDTGFGLTVPVVFQPWKYEHETHLHVPLMLHIFQALQKYEKDAQVTSEKKAEWAGGQWETAKKALPGVVEKFKGLLKASIAAMEPTTAGSAALGLGIASVLASTLKPAQEKPDPLKTFKYSEDGRFFYDMHETLKDVTRPTRQNGQKRKYSANDIAINFVVFVDDLDRCLPEKAVQTLELIKTMFNVESFAFVLALDDEVIERGIGHRYKEYKLQDKKPEMPITGFEYLEKIIHLPFKLPALSQAQARQFLDKAEKGVGGGTKAEHWFQPLPDQNKLARSGRGAMQDFELLASLELTDYDLGRLVLTSFDAYVPRKLLRIVELWHTTVQVAQARHQADPRKPMLVADSSAPIDIRIALALQMVQLFQPDLYRLFRRREATFGTLFNAFDGNVTGLSASRSDVDLWQWAAFGDDTHLPHAPRPTDAVAALSRIATLGDDKRFPAQQNRLPLVERIIDHRLAQRHVFDALKLFAELRAQVKTLPENFSIGPYFSLLAPIDEPVERVHRSFVEAGILGEASSKHTRSADPTDPQALYNSLIADDEALQQSVLAVAGLPEGAVLSARAVESLRLSVIAWMTLSAGQFYRAKARLLLNGLKYLAPILSRIDGEALWAIVVDCVDLQTEQDPKTRALWGDVRAALGCDPRFEVSGLCLAKETSVDPATAFETTKDSIPGFAYIDARTTPFWFGDGRARSAKSVRLEGIREPFYIARTLTTVAQYRQFVDSEDYAIYFKGEGQQWLQGDYDSKTSEKEVKEWLAKRPALERRKPYQWGEQLRNPLRPVVHVSWFEAQAYANWLQQKLQDGGRPGVKVALPTELQWECASRFGHPEAPTPRPFPWVEGPGNADGDKAKFGPYANTANLVGAPTTVGLYPKGGTPMGLTDMAGNVWEWMANPYVEKFDPREAISDQVETDAFALRGGAWLSDPDDARCSSRDGDIPSHWNDDLGFRVVLFLAQ